jgi:outer membrane protein
MWSFAAGMVLTLTPFCGCAQDSKAEVVTLKQCIEMTLQHHPNSTIYQNNADYAAEKIRESRAAFLPSVSAQGNLDYNIKLQTSVIPAGTFGTEETRLQMGNKFSTGAYVQADLNVLDKPSRLSIESAKTDKDIADLNRVKENESLIYTTISSYYAVQTYIEKGKLLRQNQAQYKQLLDILKLRYDQGVVRKSEYDRTRVNLNNIGAELSINDNNQQLALNELKNAMGIPLDRDISIPDSIQYTAPAQAPDIAEFDPHLLTSYKLDEKNIALRQIDIKKKQAAFMPTLSLYAKYGLNAYGSELSNAFTNWFDYSAIGMKLSIPIYNGSKRRSQLNQSKINLRNEMLTQKLNINTYTLDYRNAQSQLLSSYASLLKNKENLDLAREVLQATAMEYREGTADLSTFLDSDASFKEAQSNYTTSLVDFLNAQLAFEKSRGTLSEYITTLN